jgi:hypothetical protein
MTLILSGTNGVTFPDSTDQATGYANGVGFRNRIINGDMRIDQRNAGASVTITGNPQYVLDRFAGGCGTASKFSIQQNAGSVTPPVGFTNYLGATVDASANVTLGTTGFFFISQRIEGNNIADLNFGAANAKTVTLSFWVRSSLTGTFGGSLFNSAANRSYPYSYTISSANTWEQKSITVAGDTSGTWLTNNGTGLGVLFAMGYGTDFLGTANSWQSGFYGAPTGSVFPISTNSATFYITGVQLEVGSVATPFERRPFGTELALCQRYYYKIISDSTFDSLASGFVRDSTDAVVLTSFPVTMRVAPTALESTGTASNYRVLHTTTATTCSAVPSLGDVTASTGRTTLTVASGLTGGQGCFLQSNNLVGAYLAWSAEL